MFSIGIVGLPNVGKSTLFSALTKLSVPIASYPFTTIKPNYGILYLKDRRLEKLKEMLEPKKITPVFLEFVDIAGLVKNAHLGEGLGNQFLSHIQEVDLILEVVRLFEDKNVPHLEGKIDPRRDIEIIKKEIIERDKKIVEKRLKEDQEISSKIKEVLERDIWLYDFFQKFPSSQKEIFFSFSKKLGLLSSKPIFYLFNINHPSQKEKINFLSNSFLFLNAKEELESQEFTQKDLKNLGFKSFLDELVFACYNKLNLISFFTIKGEEIRANELKKGSNILEAAEKIHSDFKKKFKKAEVINFEEFKKYFSWQECKKLGKIEIKGKDYIVKDGDIIEFKI